MAAMARMLKAPTCRVTPRSRRLQLALPQSALSRCQTPTPTALCGRCLHRNVASSGTLERHFASTTAAWGPADPPHGGGVNLDAVADLFATAPAAGESGGGSVALGLGAGGGTSRAKLLHDEFDDDLVVIGGGSGGIAAAREAATLGAKVTVFDYVDPSWRGTTWGLGGTCVNVGCIPKKLMHHAALLGESLHDAREYGWILDPKAVEHSWETMRENVQNYVKGSNWGYKTALRVEGVHYVNAKAKLLDDHTVEYIDSASGEPNRITGTNILVAVGGRPNLLNIPGAEECTISSDDLFSLPTSPGRTLVIGGGYVALECAGFLTSLGNPVSVMIRSKPLRHFDADMAQRVTDYMMRQGTTFQMGCVPKSFQRTPSGSVLAEWEDLETGTHYSQEFDTVLLATGRTAQTSDLGLAEAGVQVDAQGKILGGELESGITEQSTVPSVYAVGDCLAGAPELTPVAAQAGRFLSHRLFAREGTGSLVAPRIDYSTVPTTVFTPLEYACVGLSEEAALKAHSEDRIEVYHLQYETLEMAGAHRLDASGMIHQNPCYTKAVCLKLPSGQEKVVGLHILGPNAGEVLQGFAVAMKVGLTMSSLRQCVGIHPTHAEEIVGLDRTKRSGVDFVKTSC